MALSPKIKYWACNYYYMSIGLPVPEYKKIDVPEVIVNSDYANDWERPLTELAGILGVEMTDTFTMDVQNGLRAAKLSCSVHVLPMVVHYVEKSETLTKSLLDAVNKFKLEHIRCIAISKHGNAFSTYCDDDGKLIGNYPSSVVFVAKSEDLKTHGDLVNELLRLNLNTCSFAQACALANLVNGGILDDVELPVYKVAGKDVALTEYLNHFDAVQWVYNMPGVYEDKWKAALEHIQETGQNPEWLDYYFYKCGLVQHNPEEKYEELKSSVESMLSGVNLSLAEFLDQDQTMVMSMQDAALEVLEGINDNVTVGQMRSYLSTEGAEVPIPRPLSKVVEDYLDAGYSLEKIVPKHYLPEIPKYDERSIAIEQIESCKTIDTETKQVIIENLRGNSTGILKLGNQELETDDYFLLAGIQILTTARKAIWADPSPANRLKWGPCVHAFLRLLMGVEANKEEIRDHLAELASAATNPETKDLLNTVLSKFF